MIYIPGRYAGRLASVEVEGEGVGTVRVTKRGGVRFSKRSRAGRSILDALDAGGEITVTV